MAAKTVILAEDAGVQAALADHARGGGGWIVATARPAEGAKALDAAGPPDLIVADLRAMALPDALLDRLAAAAAQGCALIAEIDAAQIDCTAARLDGDRVILLVDPDPIDRAAAIAAGLASRGSGILGEQDALPGLRQLSEEAGRIARALAALAETSPPAPPLPAPDAAERPAITAAELRALLRRRRLRDRFFAAEIFADPAWDMLLDLYAARLEGAQVAVSSLCIAAAVPPTTALRWINSLTRQGLFLRIADPADGRRVFVALGDGAAARMAAYFAAAG